MVKRPVQACAWRMVIMAERPANGMADAPNYQTDCGSLSASDRQAARLVAQAIHRQVYGSDLPAIPPLDALRPGREILSHFQPAPAIAAGRFSFANQRLPSFRRSGKHCSQFGDAC